MLFRSHFHGICGAEGSECDRENNLGVIEKPEQIDGKRFTYISASSRLTVWEAVGPWLERTGACWLVQQAP